MMRHTIIAAALIALVWAAAIPEVKEEKEEKDEKEIKIPEQYKSRLQLSGITFLYKSRLTFIPELIAHATKRMASLTPEEKEKLKDFAKKHPRVQRLEESYKFHKAVMAGEKPKPEEMKKWAENTISSYKKLSEDAKKDIAKQFPIAVALAKNEKVREIVKLHLAMKFGPKTKDSEDDKEVATPEQYRKLIATHILKHLANLTPEEKEKLKDFAKKVLSWLVAKAKAKLGDKAELSRKIIEKKVKALDDEARRFVAQRLEQAYKLHKAIMAGEKPKPEQFKMWAENTISNYKPLSDEKIRAFLKAILAKKFAPDAKEVEVESEEKEVTIPEPYKKLIAAHVLKHMANMTSEEKEKLKVVAKKRLEEAYKFHKAIMAGEKPEKEELKKWANNTIASYKELSDEAKKKLQSNFPSLLLWLRMRNSGDS
ncbi:nematode fatty acid retinoid binding protein [Ancylostoma duodenale]|uniref:Nematode fatty acid retinoid binding protein n=1 Tax=Ancylostoma duodenale TaxID=51022 RepID=A0A0C2DQ80_9BILA|nr:nematode fatty acid retinoid binding protein [Ancylostoma duodenale]